MQAFSFCPALSALSTHGQRDFFYEPPRPEVRQCPWPSVSQFRQASRAQHANDPLKFVDLAAMSSVSRASPLRQFHLLPTIGIAYSQH
jgi:hypothetical protein